MTEEKERRATEDLLAGFDRPGRSPRAPAVRLDFQPHAPATSHETVLVTRRRTAPLWPWLVGAFLVSAIVGVVALLFVLGRPAPVAAPLPSATIDVRTAATVPPSSETMAPAPTPIVESVVPPVPTPPKPSAAPKIVKPAPAPKPEHRGDFIPEL